MISAPFPYRLLLLALVFASLAVWHFRKDPQRWQEYAFLFFTGSAGGVFGVINDFVTSRISPAYFEVAKGLESGPGFAGRVAALGFEAGFVAAALAACALLYANNPRGDVPRATYRTLCRMLAGCLAAALALAFALGIGVQFVDAYSLAHLTEPLVAAAAAGPFLAVTAIHLGLYVGLVAGVIVSVHTIRQHRLTILIQRAAAT